MSERYSKIFSLPENIYAQGAPICIRAGALLKDNSSNWLIAQLKLQNVTDKAIKLVKVELNCLDSVGRSVGAPVVYDYLDLNALRGEDFGAQSPIKISNAATRSYAVRVTEVGFVDNTVWTDAGNAWEAMPKQALMQETVVDKEALLGYKKAFGNDVNYSVLTHKDVWLCVCGAINHAEEARCYHCNASLAELESVDLDALRKDVVYMTAVELLNSNSVANFEKAKCLFEKLGEYKDSADLTKRCESKVNAWKAKDKKRKKILAFVLAGVVALASLGYFVAYPLIAQETGNYRVIINMRNIKDYKVPEGTTEIKPRAFYNCDNLESVMIPDSVTSIGDEAFSECSSLKDITIPNGVTRIAWRAFGECKSLKAVYYKGTAIEWSNIMIDYANGYLKNATIYYYSETQPTEAGNWWHYDAGGNPVAWE